ncbi:MAG: hypothetical protein ABSE97_08100 [Verrucomicrobiota bacterium]|jgi:hypothetical protein
MKINQLRWTIRLLLLNVTLALLATGCATPTGSYNQDFHQNLPTSPNYAIENVNDTDFHVIVHQGTALKGSDRIIYVKQVASAVAENEAKNRGWKNYDLNYVQEYDQGWMHVVVADITRKNAVEKTPRSTQ